MVKQLDENNRLEDLRDPALPDHIGLAIWMAGRAWQHRFITEIQAAGHTWFGPGQAQIFGCLDRTGTRQSVIVARSGLTKQAINQAVDELERIGAVHRIRDPDDRRARIVVPTAMAHAMLRDADRIKQQLEDRLEAEIGRDDLDRLRNVLRKAEALFGGGPVDTASGGSEPP